LDQIEQIKLQEHLEIVQTERDSAQRQIAVLQTEIERLAKVLLDAADNSGRANIACR
jgi:hypothetical protein